MTLALFDHSVKGIKRIDIYLKKKKKKSFFFCKSTACVKQKDKRWQL